MAADPGASVAAYHLFLTRIPARLPKEEVEAALATELASCNVRAQVISVVPQSAWKNKGYGFITLADDPVVAKVNEIAAQLDNKLLVAGRPLSVRVCQPSATGSLPPAPSPGEWDQPPEKIARLCAQVLHCYFSRRPEQTTFKAEKLLALLSMTVAPTRGQEPKQVALWGREQHGNLERMLLAIGEQHFGGGWRVTGTVATRDAVLHTNKARHMQGWDALRDPLPIATLLRLAACKQRLDDIHTPSASSGLSTPTCGTGAGSLRRCSDCGSLSAVHSSEQPSYSESEASWSLRSLCTAAAGTGGGSAGSDCSPSLDGMPSTGSDDPVLSSATPSSCASYNSLGSCGGCEAADDGQHRAREPEPPPKDGSAARKAGPAVTQAPKPAPQQQQQQVGQGRAASSAAASSSGRPPLAPVAASAAAAASPSGQPAATAAGRQWRRSGRPHHGTASAGSSYRHMSSAVCPRGPNQPPWAMQAPSYVGPAPMALVTPPAAPPSAQDLLYRCAQHLQMLFWWHPNQCAFAVPYVLEYLSVAPHVVAWGRDSPYFSLEGYATAVYGSFDDLLLQISRTFYGGCWRIDGGRHPTEPRVLVLNARPPMSKASSQRSVASGASGAVGGGGSSGAGPGSRPRHEQSKAAAAAAVPVAVPAAAAPAAAAPTPAAGPAPVTAPTTATAGA